MRAVTKKNIVFSGLSKSADKTLIKNFEFLERFIEYSNHNVEILIVDTDSDKIIKEFLSRKEKLFSNVKVFHEDYLDKKIHSRIERISLCRNIGLNYIYNNFKIENTIYIPLDLDVELFEKSNLEEFEKRINELIESQDKYAIFPVSSPRYYDILALRAENWVHYNSQLYNHKLKKVFRIGSFLLNYVFVFRFQWKIKKIQSRKIKIQSAFGGIAIYNFVALDKKIFYKTTARNTEFVSEHVEFNNNFNKKFLDTNWVVNAPIEHISFHSYDLKNKIIYIFKTIKEDLKNINKIN